jgi:hypothetical protein
MEMEPYHLHVGLFDFGEAVINDDNELNFRVRRISEHLKQR